MDVGIPCDFIYGRRYILIFHPYLIGAIKQTYNILEQYVVQIDVIYILHFGFLRKGITYNSP